jgi:hypothetical protein
MTKKTITLPAPLANAAHVTEEMQTASPAPH